MSYSGNTLAFQAKARGSIPLIRFFSYIKGFSYATLREIKDYLILSSKFSQKEMVETLLYGNFTS